MAFSVGRMGWVTVGRAMVTMCSVLRMVMADRRTMTRRAVVFKGGGVEGLGSVTPAEGLVSMGLKIENRAWAEGLAGTALVGGGSGGPCGRVLRS